MFQGSCRGSGDMRRRVLVIDDEYAARLQVELALTNSTSVRIVGEASNGMRGAELAEELQPDVVLLDLTMPVMDGYEAIPLIRRLSPDARIVVRTSHDLREVEQRVLDLGAVRLIDKFLDTAELRAVVEAVADSIDRRRFVGRPHRAGQVARVASQRT